MKFKLCMVLAVLFFVARIGFCIPVPDSAGIVPLKNGLAYGGIPYGSVSGQLSLYYGEYEPILAAANKVSGNDIQLL